MSACSSTRLKTILATARRNPEFAAQLVLELPEPLRSDVIAELARPALKSPRAAARPGPGLRKCAGERNGMSAQLNLFARSVARVS